MSGEAVLLPKANGDVLHGMCDRAAPITALKCSFAPNFN